MSTYSTQVHGVAGGKEAEYLDGWQRERAEFQNFRKRLTTEQSLIQQRAQAAAATSLLKVADSFQTMIKHIPTDLAQNQWVQGVQHSAKQLEQILHEQGIVVISETKVPFDPTIHEAVEKIDNPKIKSGFVLEIIQVGYKLGELILKPARVKISA